MNSVLICEGPTDFVLLQYYMRKVHAWEDAGRRGSIIYANNRSRDFIRGNDILTIMSSGGCSNLIKAFENVLIKNQENPQNPSEAINKVAIITDHDEVGTESIFIHDINTKLTEYDAVSSQVITNNKWVTISLNTSTGIQLNFDLLVMIIPFSETGAMETFLLNAISDLDTYDKEIITKGKAFVQSADPQNKYLTKRCYKTKAEFDAYFCIRTASEQFTERQNILKNIPWENYPSIQNDFRLLGDL